MEGFMKDVGHHPRFVQKKVLRETRKESNQKKVNHSPFSDFANYEKLLYDEKLSNYRTPQ